MALGCTYPAGSVPALTASHSLAYFALMIASAICERHELPVHKKNIILFSVSMMVGPYLQAATQNYGWSDHGHILASRLPG